MKSPMAKKARIAAIGAGAASLVAVPAIVFAATGQSGDGRPLAAEKVRAASPRCNEGPAVQILRKVNERRSTGEKDKLVNNTNRSVKRTYTLSQTAKTKWNLNISVDAKFSAWIFAEVNASLGGGLEKESAIQSTQTEEVTVPPKTTLVVTRGFEITRIYGNTYYTWSNCKTGNYKSFEMTAPNGKYTAFK